MHPDELLDAIRTDAAGVAAALAEGPRDRVVPSTPKWDVEALVGHLGRVHRWVTAMVQTAAADRMDFPSRPDAVDVAWFTEGVDGLTAALEAAGPDQPMWTFDHGGGTSRFWFR